MQRNAFFVSRPTTAWLLFGCYLIIGFDAASAQESIRNRPTYTRRDAATDNPFPSSLHGRQPETPVAFTAPYQVIELAAAEMGRIRDLKIRRGSRVTQGQLLCELDISALEARRRTAEQRTQSTAKRQALEVEYQRKQRRLNSLQAIASQGGGTPEEVAQADAEARIAQLNVQSADEDTELAKLELAEIDAQIEQRRIRAGFDGIIVDIHKKAGEFVSSADPKVATLVDLSRLRATFFLTTDVALSLHSGDELPVRFLGSTTERTGVIEYVGPLTNADSGRVRVDVLLDNQDLRLQSGVRCTLPSLTDSRHQDSRSMTYPLSGENRK